MSNDNSSTTTSARDREELATMEELKKTIKHCSIHRNPGMSYSDYDAPTAYARGRVMQILSEHKYRTIVPGKYLPSFDLIHYCELVPFTVDIYALQYHPESTNVVTDELIVDISRARHNGLTISPYETSLDINGNSNVRRKEFVEHANQYKKQMICSHYNIDPKRYVILHERELFSKSYTKPTSEIQAKLFEEKGSTEKARDDLYVALTAS